MTEYNFTPIFTLHMYRDRELRSVRPVRDEDAAGKILQAYFADKAAEHLVILMVDGQQNFLGVALVATGGITGLHIRARDVFQPAIVHRAHAIILSHNHPSGDISPSQDDLIFTQTVAEIGEKLGCPVLDHIVVSTGIRDGYRSIWTPKQ